MRFNFLKRLVDFTPRDVLQRIAARVDKLGWHIVIYFEMPDLPELEGFFTALPTTVVVDHMGTPDVRKGVDIRRTSASTGSWTSTRTSGSQGRPARSASRIAGPPYDDVVPFGARWSSVFPTG